MSSRRALALAALAILAACGDTDPEDLAVVEVGVTAAFEVDGLDADRLTGVITISVQLPEGEPGRELLLPWIDVGGHRLLAEEIRGLDAFPRAIDGGASVRVALEVELDGITTWTDLPVAGCGRSVDLPVEVAVHDVGATEAGMDGYVIAGTTAPLAAPEAAPFPVHVGKVWDLGARFDAIAADPSRDDDLLVGTLGRVERVALDGTRRWSTPLPGVGVAGLARGGGVDAFVAWVEAGDPWCAAEDGAPTSSLVAGRLDDAGGVAWCTRLSSDFARIAVTDGGMVAVATLEERESGPGTRLLRFTPDGESLASLRVEAPPGLVLALGERLVVAGTDPTGYLGALAVVDQDEVDVLPLELPLQQVRERADGTLALFAGTHGGDREWWIVDPDTLEASGGESLGGELGGTTTFVELDDGSLLGLGELAAGESVLGVLGYELFRDGARRASGVLRCEAPELARVEGAGSAPLVAVHATGLRVAERELAAEGPMRTLVIELGDPQ